MELTTELIISHLESTDPFPIDMNDAAVWLGYSRKDSVKRSFEAQGFVEGVDYLHIYVELVGEPQVKLSVDCFKQWAMMSRTPMGKEIRLWYLKVEKEWRQLKQREQERIANRSKSEKLLKQVQEKFISLLRVSPNDAQAACRVMAAACGVETNQTLLNHEQLQEQSLAMHRIALSFNKHTNLIKVFESLTDPGKIGEIRESVVSLTSENLRLIETIGRLKSETVPRDEYEIVVDALRDKISELEQTAEYWKTIATAQDQRVEVVNRFLSLPPARDDYFGSTTKKGKR